MDTSLKSIIAAIYESGSSNHYSPLSEKKRVLREWYKVVELYLSDDRFLVLESYINNHKDIESYCNTKLLDVCKIEYKIKKCMKLLKTNEYTKFIVIDTPNSLQSLVDYKDIWLRAISVYKKNVK